MFTEGDNAYHRGGFIKECRQKAWGASCHADWIETGIKSALEEIRTISNRDFEFKESIAAIDIAPDAHTKDSRLKKKDLQETRDKMAQAIAGLKARIQQAQGAVNNLLQNVDTNLALAKFAETWEWEDDEVSHETPEDGKV